LEKMKGNFCHMQRRTRMIRADSRAVPAFFWRSHPCFLGTAAGELDSYENGNAYLGVVKGESGKRRRWRVKS
jgi:hypothetical protein